MNLKTDFDDYAWKIFLFRSLIGSIGSLIFILNGGHFLYALSIYLFFEITVNIVYFTLKRKNKLLARLSFTLSCFSPELFLIQSLLIFSYGNVIRHEFFVTIILYIFGVLYINFIYKDNDFNEDISRKKTAYATGEGMEGWPSFKSLDVIGKIYLYGAYIPMIPALLIFGLAQAYSDQPVEVLHKYIMAGGYCFMFLMMTCFGAHNAFRRAVRVVRKYNLNWD